MRPDQARAVSRIHAEVLPDSVYTWMGPPFLEYYYRNLLGNDDFFCHVHVFDGQVTGFLAGSTATGRVFFRQLARDAARIAWVFLRILAGSPGKLRVLLAATRFLFAQRRRMLPDVRGEVLSFAVLPQFRTSELGGDGRPRPTVFYDRWQVAVAVELFLASMRTMKSRGVTEVKIMTPADNVASNRFYSKVGCALTDDQLIIFGRPTNLYHGRIDELLACASERTDARHGD